MSNEFEFVVIHPDKLREMISAGEIINTGTRVSIPSLGLKDFRLTESRGVSMDQCALANRLGVVQRYVPFNHHVEVMVE
jgi:hypothetical protein